MAGNSVFTGQDGNIYVDFDVQNLIVVDPNKLVDKDGKIKERAVDQENLVMYANLETKLLPRTKLAVGSTVQDQISTVSIAEINFMKPGGQKYMTNDYTNEITGEGIFNKGTTNKSAGSFTPSTGQKPAASVGTGLQERQNDTGLLGITSINVKVDTSFIPQVTVELEDIQGRALFEKGDLSPYAAFFNLPYPPFYLTLKGYYGQAIRYQLNLISFNARFNTFSGNYQVTLQFYGYKFNILNEISIANMFAVPHMYQSTYNVTKRIPNSNDSTSQKQLTEGGTQKIKEVYADYKSKALIPKDFPELSVNELLNRLEVFAKNLQNSWTKADVLSLTESKKYKDALLVYKGDIYTNPTSWFNEFCDQAKAVKLTSGEIAYPLKPVVKEGTTNTGAKTLQAVDADLKNRIQQNNAVLASNPVFGKDQAKNKNLIVQNDVDYQDFAFVADIKSIDYQETFKARTKSSENLEGQALIDYRNQITRELGFATKISLDGNSQDPATVTLYVFEGANRFTGLIDKMTDHLNSLSQLEEERLTALLAARLEDKATGIGFKPSIRNVITVIMASAEAFIRLLDDVHKKAWDKRDDPDRKKAILVYPSSDAKDNVQISDKQNLTPIYPWPQFFVNEGVGNDEKFVIKYPGDRTVSDLTKGYLFEKWPEIQFVEEFLKGYTERGPQVKDTTENDNESNQIDRLTLNAIEFPQTNLPYLTKEEVKFFFEIWERTYLNSHYQRFQRGGDVKEIYNTIGRNEADNIKQALNVSSPYLIQKFKNYGFNFQNYLGVLSHVSNQGTGPSIQKLIRDIFATGYIQTEVDTPFEIYDQSIISSSSPFVDRGLTNEDLTNLNSLIKKNIEPDFCDTYPFTRQEWNDLNLQDSNQSKQGLFYLTRNTLFVNEEKKVISNFTPNMTKTTIRPVTNFSYKNFSLPIVPQNDLKTFYQSRKVSQYIATEGTVFANFVSPLNPSNSSLPAIQTTSILNTPYFVNALQNGVDDWKNKKEYPFVQGAYLLLNSLPLATLREKYKTQNDNTPLDYIASSLKRFGGIHRMPYAWILKIGSIYHRYKRFANDGVDILDTCWKDFDYVRNFDPITNTVTKTYSLRFDGVDTSQIYLQSGYSATTLPVAGVSLPITTTEVQGGFYPKLINDMSYFFNGSECFQTYSDGEIQLFVDSNMKVANVEGSSVNIGFVSGNSPLNYFKMQPWTALMKNTTSEGYYTIPSFGSVYNQTQQAIFDSNTTQGSNVATKDILNNQSMYNGTVRCFWGVSNYGYFDNSLIRKPSYDEYMTIVNPSVEVSPMDLGVTYSNIEEIFSVFSKDQLDKLELKFLEFSKSVYNMKDNVAPGETKLTLNVDPTDPDRYLKNFQLMMRECFEINGPLARQTNADYAKSAISQQFSNIVTIMNNFMEYDIIMKMGNPSNYDRRLFDSFLPDYNTGYKFTDTSNSVSNPTQVDFILADPLKFSPYVPNSLPTQGGTTTLVQSFSSNSDAWKELLLQLGPTTIDKLAYSDQGSYITDFFVTNDIEFTKNNVKICAPLIRIFATQKLSDETLTKTQFQSKLKEYSNQMISYQENVFNNLMLYLRKELPDISFLPEGSVKSAIDGNMVKTQMWEMFKAVNDKWIAGNSYNEETLLQDFLFVDRASRNVGDSIFVDIYSLKNKLRNLNLDASVFTLIGSILTENHFSVMPLPAYVNFYNIQTPDGTSTPKTENSADFANNLWGTFLSVDYRNSQPKMVCFYSEKPSNYPDLGRNKDFRYKNDGFACNNLTNNPLLENQTNKTDWSQSNRCVGFNVDMGIRNQGVFYSFSVSQDIGTATSESLISTNNLANQASGRYTASQNVSLLNIYNERSYSCNVVALGNAMIQPTMYFCLNHVPMFNGAYLITEVNHTITPGQFQTSFTGVRQRIFASEKPNNYLMSLNQNLLQKLPSELREAQSSPTTGAVNQTSSKSNAGENSCQDSVLEKYTKGYNATTATETKLTSEQIGKVILDNIPASITSDSQKYQLAMMVYAFSFVSSADAKGLMFQSYGNNYSNVDLQVNWGASGTNYFKSEFCCVNVGTDKGKKPKPFAKFETIENFVKFMYDRLFQSKDFDGSQLVSNTIVPTADAMYNKYKSFWPVAKNQQQQNDFETNQGKEVKAKIVNAMKSITEVFPRLGVNLATSTTTTTTPTGQQVNPAITNNADDRTILSSANPSSYTLNVSTLSNGFLKVEGNIGTTPLSKEYKLKIYLVPTQGIGSEVLIGETSLTPKAFGQNNGYSFTTTKSFRRECDIAADPTSKSLGFRVAVSEYPEYKYYMSYKVMNYDCPTRNLLPGDVVTVSVYDQIDQNPCQICYPNGGPNIRINGKDCLPNTRPPRENIFNTTTDKDANGKITKVTFTVKPDAGIWKIFTGKYDSKCVGSTANGITSGDISQNKQSISFDIVDTIGGCDPGAYTVKLEATAQAYLQDGGIDNTKLQQYTTYVVQGVI
jgi:hypothetical protein